MRKFTFSFKSLLVAAGLLLGSANAWGAPTFWKVTSSTPVTADRTYVSTDYLNIVSTSAGTLESYGYNYSDIGENVSKSIRIRAAVAPTTENPSGTANDGSTRLVITVASKANVAFYYRRQADNGASSNCTYTENNGKDLKIVNQNAPTTELTGTMTKESDCTTSDTYGHVKKAYTLSAGTYTVYATSTTIQLNAISYEEASLYPYSVGTSTAATYLQYASPEYMLTGDGTINISFTNYCVPENAGWLNWHLICGNISDSPSVGDVNTNRLFVMRADRWENIAWSADAFSNVSAGYLTDMNTYQNGATVDLAITRSGTTVNVVTTVTKDENVQSMTYTKTNVSDETLKFYLTGSNSYLTIASKPTVTKIVAPNWDFTDTNVWSTSKFSSSATYAPDGTTGTLGATGITFNLPGKVNSISAEGGMSFSSSASATLEGNIPTNNYIKVSVPAGYKASVEFYGYNSGRYLGFTFGGEKMYVPSSSSGGFQNHTKKEFDNSEGSEAKDLYLYAVGVNSNGHAKIYSINLFNASGMTHSWTATAKATINGVATQIDTWNSTSGNYTTTIHEGENYYVPAKRVITYDGKYYELNDDRYSGTYLYKTYNMGLYDASYDITYTEASDIVYFSEIESVASKQHTQSNQASSGKYVNFMTTYTIPSPASFSVGSYKVEANMFDRKPGSATNFYIYKNSSASAENIIATFAINNNDNGKKTQEFTLEEPASLIVGNTSNSASCDYILIRKVTERAKVTPAGYATFSSPYPLDLTTANTPAGLTAYYIAEGDLSKNNAPFTAINQTVAAGEGILLKGAANTYNIKIAASGTALSDNALVATNGSAIGVGNYVFAYETENPSTTAGFYYVSAATSPVAAGKAYLDGTKVPNDVKSFIFGDDTATGVDAPVAAEAEEDGIYYNLNGQQVTKDYKGIVIKNGKKYLNK